MIQIKPDSKSRTVEFGRKSAIPINAEQAIKSFCIPVQDGSFNPFKLMSPRLSSVC